MEKPELEKLGTIEVVVIGIYGRFSKFFILMVTNGLGPKDMYGLSFFLELYAQYNHLVELYSTGRPATTLIKNVAIVIYTKQQLVTNFSTIFLIRALDIAIIQKLSKVHSKNTKGQDFATNFKITWSF
jgi:hypothetical protein